MSETLTTVENKVRAIREALNLTQKQMAEEMGISLSALRRYEYDSALPGTLAGKKALAMLAKKAGVSLDATL